ncbi:hypothetical protein CKO12_07950 [Chromatium okenii]|uniref:hypothetical protein n=1 Tax=Chromatium okenii TaxID=61644 RepID=UPI0019088EE6|nr:hypothetical protein [Chromatium okenii]MBK1641800.1 hypothetical protein [Chromatium okenii]
MKDDHSEQLFSAHVKQGERAFAQLRVWRVTNTTTHHSQLKYRLAFIVNGGCAFSLDNDTGAGRQLAHPALTPEAVLTELLNEFWQRVDEYHAGQV